MVAKRSLFLLVPLAVSCGGDDGPKVIKTDSGVKMPDAAPPDNCKVNSSYSPTFNQTGSGHHAIDVPPNFNGDTNGHIIYSYGLLEPIPQGSNLGDYLEIDLFAEYGGFGSGDIVPGTYVIANEDTSWDTCGICVALQGDYNIDTDEIDDWLLAQTGQVVITEAAGSAYKVSLMNATFQRVTVDEDGNPTTDAQTDIPCTSSIGSATFDLPLEPAQASATGKAATGRHALRRTLRHRFY
jgi:hypothetical protein